jgi:anti-sigma B factor antagonist
VTTPVPVDFDRRDEVPVARLSGEVEISRAIALRERLLRAVGNQDFGLVVDLSRTTYLDSAGVNVLFDVAERLQSRQLVLALSVPADGLVRRVVEMVALSSVAAVHATEEEAVAAVREQMPA